MGGGLRRTMNFAPAQYANGNKAMARPSPAYMKYIKELGIKHICYSTADGIAEERID